MITTSEFVESCQIKYRWENLPKGERWENAHHPVPDCLGGGETVRLWSSDHHIHGILQSVECDHKCFFSTTRQFLTGDWEWLVPYFNHYNTAHITYDTRVKAAHKMHSKTTKEQRSKAGKIGGPIGGKFIRTDQTLAKMREYFNSEECKKVRSDSVTKTNKRLMRCTVTGYIGNPGNVGKHQKKLGIEPGNREWVNDTST